MGNPVRPLAFSLAALLCVGALLPQTAGAQPVPSYAQRSNDVEPHNGQETISGTVSLVQGEYVEINDDRGYVDRVDFTTETLMRPSGLRLRKGMRVSITGYNQGQIFDAYEIAAAGAAPPAYSGNAPSYGYDGQAPAPVPMTAQAPPPPEPAQAYPPSYPPSYQTAYPPQQALPPYATPVPGAPYGYPPQPQYAVPVYAQPVYVPYPVYAPPPYAYYPRWYVRFGARFR
jgi:hypothetical protein